MKTYQVTERQAESETTSEGSFAQVAYEWNNALLLAARRLWGEHAVEAATEGLQVSTTP